tara:strand:+ start:1447 stop:1788 length:342 start_codon:yes stop_codon:yes gene_type:complete
MKGETYLYAVNALGGADDGGVWKASDFMAAEIASASTVELRFKAGNDAAKNGVVTLTTPANLGTENKLIFKTICKQISGLLNKANGKMFVLADEVNGVYMQPFTGAVVVDDVN